jgi:TPR repeat protein
MQIKGKNAIDELAPWKLQRDDVESETLWEYAMSRAEWKVLLEKAENGDPEAQWELADRYHDGCRDENGKLLVKRSPRRAAEWFRKSAEAGYAPTAFQAVIVI